MHIQKLFAPNDFYDISIRKEGIYLQGDLTNSIIKTITRLKFELYEPDYKSKYTHFQRGVYDICLT